MISRSMASANSVLQIMNSHPSSVRGGVENDCEDGGQSKKSIRFFLFCKPMVV